MKLAITTIRQAKKRMPLVGLVITVVAKNLAPVFQPCTDAEQTLTERFSAPQMRFTPGKDEDLQQKRDVIFVGVPDTLVVVHADIALICELDEQQRLSAVSSDSTGFGTRTTRKQVTLWPTPLAHEPMKPATNYWHDSPC